MIRKAGPGPSTALSNNEILAKLLRVATDLWLGIDEDMVNDLVGSVPRRLHAVIQVNGWYTK